MIISPQNSPEALRKEFAFLKYSPAAQTAKEPKITVNHNAYWSYCGPLLSTDADSPLPANFHDFAETTFSSPILPRLLPFLDFVNGILRASGLSHYLLTIRATTPTHEFDRPRWHTDELFFSDLARGDLPGIGMGQKSQYGGKKEFREAPGTNWKICTTLLGPPTLFIPLEHQSTTRQKQHKARQAASTDHACLSIRCVGCASSAESVRDDLATNLAQFGAKAARPGECAMFRVGRESGAMHSEPCMSSAQHGRIFINVVPGTEEELRGMMGKWGMEFPRQWWQWWVQGYNVQPLVT
ncbi:hypothetical protein QQX98_000882 [Neonectria punicea]|uniref:Uncharacterized protein n=1 Tax=Neonectria punicea TaxID=979145 RepID=A0ABR1HS93_9HYPO